MNHTLARRSTWIVIVLVLLIGGGAYFWFRTKAAVTIGSDNPSFQADLKSTLALQAGVGSPTFTRATVATVTDFEGLIKTAKSGEARFEGARRVQNLVTYSENFSHANWTKDATTVITTGQSDPFGGLNASKVQNTTAGNGFYQNLLIGSGGVRQYSVWLRGAVGGEIVQLGDPGENITITNEWARYSTYRASAASTYMIIRIFTANATVFAYGTQAEVVTGQTNTNPSEYISTNVLSAPYHGAGADGVKYFTTQNGNTVASNVVTEATGAAIPDATLHGYLAEGARTNSILQSQTLGTTWTATNITVATDSVVSPAGTTTADTLTASATDGTLSQAITGTAASWTFSVYLKRLTGTGTVSISANGTGFTACTINDSTWTRCTDTRTLTVASYSPTIKIGTNTDAVYAWGAQMEAGAFASNYIATTTAAVTRNSDVLSYPTSGNVSTSIGTAYVEASTLWTTAPSSAVLIGSSTTSSSNYALGQRNGFASTGIDMRDGTNAIQITNLTSMNTGIRKLASYWSGSAMKIYGSGGTPVAGSFDGSLFADTTAVSFGNSGNASTPWNGTIRNVRIWKKALTDTQLTNLTSTTTAVSQSAVQKTTIKATGITTINVAQNTKLIDGIVGMWSFNGPDISGATAFDRSGQGHDATLVNRPAPAQGKVAQGLSFNGTTHSATIGSAYNGVKTISFWVKPTTTTQPLIDLNGTATIDINSGTIRGNTFSTPTIYADGAPISTISNTSWHFIALTTDTGINASNMTIGKIASTYFSGTLDEVRLYSRALSANEVWQLYSLGTSAFECGASSVRDADGNAYATVQVGTQCWMASNLKVGTRIAGASSQTNNGIIEKYCYSDTDANCLTDGGLYQWDEAMQYSTVEGARGICPAGWHIPSDAQQNALDQYLTDSGQTCDAARSGAWDCSTAGTKLKTGGTSGMNIPLAGDRNTDGSFFNRAAYAYLWSSLQSGGNARHRSLSSGVTTVNRLTNSKAFGFSVRCLKD